MIKAFRTDAHPPGERTEYWVEAVRQAATRFEIRPRDDTALSGSLWAASVGEIHVGPCRRGPSAHGPDPDDHLRRVRRPSAAEPPGGGQQRRRPWRTRDASHFAVSGRVRRAAALPAGLPRSFPPERRCRPLPETGRSRSYLANLIGQMYPPTHHIGGILSSFVSRLAAAAESGDRLPGAERHLQWGLTNVLTALAAHKGRLHTDVTPTAAETQGCLSGTTSQHTCTGGTSPRPRSPRLTACPCAICTSCSKTRTCPSAGESTTSGRKPAARIRRVPPRPARRWERSPEMGLRQPRALQPELSCRLRPVPWRVAPHGQ